MKKIAIFVTFALAILGLSFFKSKSDKQDEKGLTVEQYTAKVNNKDKIVLVYFNADWCVPCKKLKPIIEQLEAEEKEKAIILKMNVDHNPEIGTHFEINTLPLFYLYRNGKIVWQNTGILSKKELADKINLYKY